MRDRTTEGDTAAGGDVDDVALGLFQLIERGVGDAQRGQEIDVERVNPFLIRNRG
jgi:hypothetical protein